MRTARRRILALTLLVVGALLMLFVPHSEIGLIVLAGALLLEVVGMVLQKRQS